MGRSRDVDTSIRMVVSIGFAAISVIVSESIHKYTVFLAEKLRNYSSGSTADTSFRLMLAENTVTNHIANILARFFGTNSKVFEVASGSLFSILSYFSIKNRERIDLILVPLTVLLTQRLTALFEEAYMRYIQKLYARNAKGGTKGITSDSPRRAAKSPGRRSKSPRRVQARDGSTGTPSRVPGF